MTLFAVLMFVFAVVITYYGFWLDARDLKKRQQAARDPVIGVDQHTEARRLQHANVGHKAAKGFHSVKHEESFSRGPVK